MVSSTMTISMVGRREMLTSSQGAGHCISKGRQWLVGHRSVDGEVAIELRSDGSGNGRVGHDAIAASQHPQTAAA